MVQTIFTIYLASLNVAAEINLIRQFSNINLESILNLVEDLRISLVGHEGDGKTLGAKSACPGNSVKVSVGVLWHIVVEDDVDSLNVHSSPEEVGGHQYSFLEILKLLVPR